MTHTDMSVLLTTLLLSIWLWYLYELYRAWGWKPSRKKLLRLLRFRTPHDCPCCGEEHLGRCERVVASKPLPLAWSQVKSPRGRKKWIKTDGHRPGYFEHPFGFSRLKVSWRHSDWVLNP